MTNNTSTFTPSTQILETAEQAQALADAGKAFKPLFSPEIQKTVDGVDKIATALNSTGEALRHFGFDEAEPEFTTTFEDGPRHTDASQVTNWTTACFDEYEDEIIGGSTLQEKAEGVKQIAESYPPKELAGPLDAAGKIQAVVDYTQYDPANPRPTLRKIKEAANNNDRKAINRLGLSPVNTSTQVLHEEAVRTVNDPNASVGDKIKYTVADAALQSDPLTSQVRGFENLIIGFGKLTGWYDEMGPEAAEGPAFNSEFSSNPESLTPIDLNSSFVSDAYQQQVAAGADLIGGQMNQGTEPYQAQDSQYAVLA